MVCVYWKSMFVRLELSPLIFFGVVVASSGPIIQKEKDPGTKLAIILLTFLCFLSAILYDDCKTKDLNRFRIANSISCLDSSLLECLLPACGGGGRRFTPRPGHGA
jgi:hypothetical protein